MYQYQINPSQPITMGWGNLASSPVTIPAGQWTLIKPDWMCSELLQAMQDLAAGGVSYQLMGPSEQIFTSANPNLKVVLQFFFQQLVSMKIPVELQG